MRLPTPEMQREEDALFASLRRQTETPTAKPSTDDPRSKLAAVVFGKRWERIATLPGKSAARNKMRKAAEQHVKLDALRRTGAACATCNSFETRKPYPGWKDGPWCSYDSDFHGTAIAKPNGLCLAYRRKTTP